MSLTNIQVFIVEDHQLISEAWKHLLKDEENITVVGTADNQNDAILFANNLRPDIILMDINLKQGNGKIGRAHV